MAIWMSTGTEVVLLEEGLGVCVPLDIIGQLPSGQQVAQLLVRDDGSCIIITIISITIYYPPFTPCSKSGLQQLKRNIVLQHLESHTFPRGRIYIATYCCASHLLFVLQNETILLY